MKKHTIKNRKETPNSDGQLKITGTIILTEDVKMRNTENDGTYPWNKRQTESPKKPFDITVKAGTEVEYLGIETRMAFYHKARVRQDGILFEKSIEDRDHECTKK